MEYIREFISTLNWVDYVIVVAFLRGAYVGYREGLVGELLRVFSYAAAFISAIAFSSSVIPLLEKYLSLDADAARTAAMAIVFIAVFAVLKVLAVIIVRIVKVGEGFLFNMLGLTVGVVRWAVILSIAFMVIERAHITLVYEDISLKSRFAQGLLPMAPTAFDYIASFIPPSPAPAAP